MIIEHAAGRHKIQAAQFQTDEHNNLCVMVSNRCVRVYAAGTWSYVEIEDG